MKTLSLALVICCSGLCGCVRTVTTAPYRFSEVNSGVVYSLPKTKLRLIVTYTVRRGTNFVNGVPDKEVREVFISKPVVVEPLVVADVNNTFVLSGEKMVKDGRLDASFKFQINDNQLLGSVASETQDKSPEIFQGLVGSAISIAKAVAVAGRELPKPLKQISERLKAINDELAETCLSSTNRAARLEQLAKEQAALVDAAKRYLDLNSTKYEEKDVTYSRILDLADFGPHGGTYSAEIKAPGAKLGGFQDSEVPAVWVELSLSDVQIAQSRARYFTSKSLQAVEGVVYRVPTPVHVKISAMAALDKVVVFDDDVPFAQVGPFNKVEARCKTWAKRKTQVSFSSTTGSIKEYGVDTTSSAEAVAKSLDASLGRVQTALEDISKTQQAAASAEKSPEQLKTAELEQQRKLVEAETALLKAQRELEKLRSGSD